ncbi:replication initiator protein A [Brucella anthropi]|uniref:replication initiator protein A n=1 Tax=Brucella anthropi TaxID=529 RepID=UPI00124D0D66|nr:replication initiator protein A [Brucella anthropi]KAB2726496.1 replication initiator protein A [Brucella anthropi]KAB2743658.1 replication initiator protein A [Brucella anthropi]KAB2804405.1 replication initiator protein A [Brucella anthropi]
MSRYRPPASERAQLDAFVIATGDASPRDQRDLMERPFFSLAKAKRIVPIRYASGDVRVEVFAVPEHGMATIWDADVLIWAASQIVEAQNHGLVTSRFLRFTPYQLLTATGRGTGIRAYELLKGALDRLQSTSIRTTIRHDKQWRRHQFSWINEWEMLTRHDGRVEGMEFVLPDWFYRGVIDRTLVLAIDPAYFRLSGGLERWLYRVARKHAGRQPEGWRFEFSHLHRKSGSLARPSDFALHMRRLIMRQPLPGYRLAREIEDGRELLRIQPVRLWKACGRSVDGICTSNASTICTSHAAGTVLRTQGQQLSLWPEKRIPALNLYNPLESNFCRGARPGENRLLDTAGDASDGRLTAHNILPPAKRERGPEDD